MIIKLITACGCSQLIEVFEKNNIPPMYWKVAIFVSNPGFITGRLSPGELSPVPHTFERKFVRVPHLDAPEYFAYKEWVEINEK